MLASRIEQILSHQTPVFDSALDGTLEPLAQRGRSKEKRSDCPLVTLRLVLDGSGFPRTSKVFSGNAS